MGACVDVCSGPVGRRGDGKGEGELEVIEGTEVVIVAGRVEIARGREAGREVMVLEDEERAGTKVGRPNG